MIRICPLPLSTVVRRALRLPTQCLSRLAPYPSHKPSVYPAWRLPTNPVFIPLGAYPRTQVLSRSAAAHKPSVYPASAQVIEKNGGERLDTLNHEGERLYRYRYRIRRNAA